MRKKPFYILLFLAVIFLSARAFASTTVKVSPAPGYNPTTPIPLTVGLVVDEASGVQSHGKSRTNSPYGPMIAAELKELKVFKSIVYPYKKGAPADAVLLLNIKGKWEYFNAEHQPYDYWSGSSAGHFAEGAHEVKVIMTAADRRIINDSMQVKSRSQYSGQDYDLVASRLNEAQAKKIAITLANFLQDKRDRIMAQIQGNPRSAALPNSPVVSKKISAAEVKTGQPGEETGQKLNELKELHSSGVLSDEDFNKAKTRLIQMQKLEDLYKSGVLSEQEYKRAKARITGK